MNRMKRWTVPLVALLAVSFAGAVVVAAAKDGKTEAAAQVSARKATCLLGVKGMGCASCEWAVRSALKKVPGFLDADVSYRDGQARVTYDPAKTDPGSLALAVVRGAGYKTSVEGAAKAGPGSKASPPRTRP